MNHGDALAHFISIKSITKCTLCRPVRKQRHCTVQTVLPLSEWKPCMCAEILAVNILPEGSAGETANNK